MLRTSQEYRERLFQMRPNIYIGGEKVSRDDHRLIPGINVLEVTYDLAHNPKWKGIMTVHSPLIGEETIALLPTTITPNPHTIS